MRTLLIMDFRNFEVLTWDEDRTENVIMQFHDKFSALVFLRQFLHDPLSMMNIRKLLNGMSSYGDISSLSDHQVLEQFAWQLISGRIRISELPVFEMCPSSVEPFRESPAPELEPGVVFEKQTSWIDIELIGMDNKPIPNERYEITWPDGKTVAKGSLNEKGFAREKGFKKGTCQVCFPDLDKEAWERI